MSTQYMCIDICNISCKFVVDRKTKDISGTVDCTENELIS